MTDLLRTAHDHLAYALGVLGKIPAEELPPTLIQSAEVLRAEVYEMIPPGVDEPVVLEFPKRGKYAGGAK